MPGISDASTVCKQSSITLWLRVLSWILAAIWLISAANKLIAFHGFADLVRQILPYPPSITVLIAVSVVVVELLTGILTAMPRKRSLGLRLSGLLSAVFLSANLLRIAEGIGGACGCIVPSLSLSPQSALALNAILFVLSLVLYRTFETEVHL